MQTRSSITQKVSIKPGEVQETVDQLKAQGIALVDIGQDRFVPTASIMVAKPFSENQAKSLADKSYKLGQEFKSTIETTAGIVLSTGQPQQVMDRKVRALGLGQS